MLLTITVRLDHVEGIEEAFLFFNRKFQQILGHFWCRLHFAAPCTVPECATAESATLRMNTDERWRFGLQMLFRR